MHDRRKIARSAVLAGAIVGSLFTGGGSVAAGPRATTTSATARAATTAQRNSVLRLYRAYFLRDPDSAGWTYWSNEYASGRRTLQWISDYFASSKEFRDRYGALSDAEFVRLVYSNVLGRSADEQGEQHWVSSLRSGLSRGGIMIGFSESVEFQKKTGTYVAPPAEDWTQAFLRLINAERARHGRGALSLCPPLTAAANGHSQDMASRRVLSHIGSNGSTFDARIRAQGYAGKRMGENVAAGQQDVQEVFTAWLNSGPHRDNMLHPDFTHVGIARVNASDGTPYWAQSLGAGGRC